MTQEAVKCKDLGWNTKSEGKLLGVNWRWCTKAWVSTWIRDPLSPCRKRWIL